MATSKRRELARSAFDCAHVKSVSRKVPGPLVDERTHYVTICIFSDSEPVWRSPWLTLEDARALRERKAEEVRRAGWSHVVRMFYRDGSEVV